VLATTTTIAIAIRGAIPALTKLADVTSTQADNAFLLWLTPKLDSVIATLDVIRRVMPRVVVGPLPRTQPLASASGRTTLPSMRPVSMPPPPGGTLRPWPVVLDTPAPHDYRQDERDRLVVSVKRDDDDAKDPS